jgi:WD40 repeat protein
LVSSGREGAGKVIRVWDTATGTQVGRWEGARPPPRVARLTTLPDGRVLAELSAGRKGSVWSFREAVTGREILTTSTARGRVVSPDGRVLAVVDRRGEVVLLEMATGGKIGCLPGGHRGAVTALAFSPDGKFLVTGSADTSALVWGWRSACGLLAPLPTRPGPRELGRLWADLAAPDARTQ